MMNGRQLRHSLISGAEMIVMALPSLFFLFPED